ncbi:MAG TPA: T9SS type A sorting domain-containing protein, partial [Bacteroidia bacterium]|nr:T9SS type A sorting domain-containing protein [Bacteroidia bacterium]
DITSSGDILACGYRESSASIIKASSTFDLCSDSLYGISESSLTVPTQGASPTITNSAISAGTWSKTPNALTTITDACTNVGLAENGNDLSLSIYPNPVMNELHIESTEPINRIRIFDATGRLVYDLEYKNKFKLDLVTSGFRKGIYNVQIQTDKRFSNISILKLE